MNLPEQFLLDWFGTEGREIGCPERFFTADPKELLRLIQDCCGKLKPCYMSVQPYKARDQPCAIEKLFFDFDSQDPIEAWKDASRFAETLKRFYKVEPLIVYSGRKGFHVYVFLEKTVEFELDQASVAKSVYSALQERLAMGLELHTLDESVIGDIKRLARVPFSIHEETGSFCYPVNWDRQPIIPENLDTYRTLDSALLTSIIKEIKTRWKFSATSQPKFSGNMKGIRPCIEAALHSQLTGGTGHLMRLAVAREYLAAGCSINEVVSLFSGQNDFNPEKTRYYVQYAQRNSAAPFKCATIRKLGYCLPNCKRTGHNLKKKKQR